MSKNTNTDCSLCRQIIFGAASGKMETLFYEFLCSLRIRKIWTFCWQWVPYLSRRKLYEILLLIFFDLEARNVYLKFQNTNSGKLCKFYVLRNDDDFSNSNLDYEPSAEKSDNRKCFLALIRMFTPNHVNILLSHLYVLFLIQLFGLL